MPLWSTIKLEIFTLRFYLLSILFSLLYVFLFAIVSNNKLIIYSISNFSTEATISLVFSLALGLPQSLSKVDLIFLIATSVLVGLNISLILIALGRLKNQKVRLSVGGGTVLALVATGCSACGLSIISLFGLSAATFSFLPLKGIELNLFAIGLLLFSFLYTLKKLNEACEVKA